MAEIMAIAVASACCAIRPLQVRDEVTLACAGIVFAYAQYSSGYLIDLSFLLVMRSLAGCMAGVIVAIAVARISVAPRPDVLTAAFVLTQTVAQIAITLGVDEGTASSCYPALWFDRLALIGITIAATSVIAGNNPKQSVKASIHPHWPSSLMLCSAAAYLGTVGAIWSYLDRLATSDGLSSLEIRDLTVLTLAASLAGSAVAIPLVARVRSLNALRSSWIGMGLSIAALLSGHPSLLRVGMLAFGFFWTWALPFQAQFLMQTTGGRSMMTLAPLAQLGGTAMGALIAGLIVEVDGPVGSSLVGAAMLMISAWAGKQAFRLDTKVPVS